MRTGRPHELRLRTLQIPNANSKLPYRWLTSIAWDWARDTSPCVGNQLRCALWQESHRAERRLQNGFGMQACLPSTSTGGPVDKRASRALLPRWHHCVLSLPRKRATSKCNPSTRPRVALRATGTMNAQTYFRPLGAGRREAVYNVPHAKG